LSESGPLVWVRHRLGLALASLFLASIALIAALAVPEPLTSAPVSDVAIASPAGVDTTAAPTAAVAPGSQPGTTPAAGVVPAATLAGTPGSTTPPLIASALALEAATDGATVVSTGTDTWTFDLYDPRAERWQNPDLTACTAAAALSMLNTISYNDFATSIQWLPTLSFTKQESIFAYERLHMTMLKKSAGSDPHGWRNALNFFGWGSIDAGVYQDFAYSSIDAAEKAVVSALALYRKPVGVVSQLGAHAEFVTGYKVVGDDPSTGSSNFRVVGVFLSDPWRSARYRDKYITYARWRWGFTWSRFGPYLQTDSPYRDPIDGQIGEREWYGRWVIVAPVK
jgi:hypothetical protein